MLETLNCRDVFQCLPLTTCKIISFLYLWYTAWWRLLWSNQNTRLHLLQTRCALMVYIISLCASEMQWGCHTFKHRPMFLESEMTYCTYYWLPLNCSPYNPTCLTCNNANQQPVQGNATISSIGHTQSLSRG